MSSLFVKIGMIGALSVASFAANAGTITFGQFGEFTAVKTFSYVNKDMVTTTGKKGAQVTTIAPSAELTSIVKSGTKMVMGTPIVNYTSLIAGNGIAAGETVKAYLSISAASEGGVTNSAGGLSQLFDGTVKLTNVATGKDIVTATFVGGSLNAKLGASSFVFDANSTTGTLAFASDIYSNLGATNDFALSGSGLSSKISYVAGHSLNYKGGYNADITGTLSTVPVSEPGAVAVLGFGLVGASVARRRRAL